MCRIPEGDQKIGNLPCGVSSVRFRVLWRTDVVVSSKAVNFGL